MGRLCTNPLPVKHPVTIQDGGIEPIYLAFRIPLRNNACIAGYQEHNTVSSAWTPVRIAYSEVLHSNYQATMLSIHCMW